MSGNTLGKIFCVTNFGESHGKVVGCVIDGCPARLPLDEEVIQKELDRRKPGTSRHVTQRQESDQVQILSGVYQGLSTGTPIALLIPNTDAKSKDYTDIEHLFRPGHADYTYWKKYGIRDPRGGGRSSARLTAPTVAAGAVARWWLKNHLAIDIQAYMLQIGTQTIAFEDLLFVNQNPFFAPCQDTEYLATYLDHLRKSGDSCGALLQVIARNVPVGLGEPIYDKLDADIAKVMMGLNAVKGVEIGSGFDSVEQLGSQNGDIITTEGFLSNHAGGILGGISSGQDIVVKVAIKPTSSIRLPRPTINTAGEASVISTLGRHDPCVGIRAAPILEALMALVLIDHVLIHRAKNEH
ncbi:MAG: chorismate synthase [Gammaproteobacteria bacterium]|nr:chorismate synthase [Gammaproteobacteria bacterium]